MRIATRFSAFLCALLVVSVASVYSFAIDSDQLPAGSIHGLHVKSDSQLNRVHSKQGNIPTPHGFPQGIDTIVNFTHHFEAPGVYLDGSPHHVWEYSMVGNDPAKGGTTVFNAPVIPVTVDLRNADGSPRFAVNQFGQTVRLIDAPDNFVQPFLNGPVFGVANYSSSPVPTQVTDAIQRAEFGSHARADWHTLLAPTVKAARKSVVLNRGQYLWGFRGDGSCCVVLADADFWNNQFAVTTPTPDNSSVVGAAEVNGDITTKDISTFLFPDTYLYTEHNPAHCCVLGFHTIDFEPGDASNGNRLKFYVLNYSSWISPGVFADPACGAPGGDGLNCFQDITANSHEIAETFNDPFVGFDNIHNITPWWQSGGPGGQCQPLMEDGDVIEVLNNATVPVTIGGVTYHPQTEALLPWFEFQKNSMAIDGAYSYPNENTLTQLSAPQNVGCN